MVVENEISERIINCALKVHRALGPGLLESSYEACLAYELIQAGFFVERQKPIPLVYGEISLDCGYRVDLFVEKKVIVEIKTVEAFADIHSAQVLTYLKLSQCKLGLLINFNVKLLKDGIKRIVNNL